MNNPWLSIPARDYEAHMASPAVGQAQVLAELLAAALDEYRPESLALLGCATGNGLEHVDAKWTRRVEAVDVNPRYLAIVEERFGTKLPGLTTTCGDLADPAFRLEPVDLAFAGLLFEYLDPRAALTSIVRGLKPEGRLVVVLQLPAVGKPAVTATPYRSLERLTPLLRLIPPADFADHGAAVGLRRTRSEAIALPSGKSLHAAHFRSGV